MRSIFLQEFQSMQKNLKQILAQNDSKFSFTMDGWSAKNFKSFYGITCHFIDKLWILRSAALDLIASHGKHAAKDISKMFLKCLNFFEITDKIQGITMDNASVNTKFVLELEKLLVPKKIDFDSEDQAFKCFAHVINLAVQDIMKLLTAASIENDEEDVCEEGKDYDVEESDEEEIDVEESEEEESMSEGNGEAILSQVIFRIRSTCKKIRRSEQLQEHLKLLCNVHKKKFLMPVIDVKTRWNSTFKMLSVVFEMLPAIQSMWATCPELAEFKVHNTEIDNLIIVYDFLKQFKLISTLLESEKDVTLPYVVISMNVLLDNLEKKIQFLDNKDERSQEDETLLLAFQAGRDKLVQHYQKSNWIYCVSLILDPRFKYQGFDKTEWGQELKNQSVKKFEQLFREKYYDATLASSNSSALESQSEEEDFFNSIYDSTTSQAWQNEIEMYNKMPRESRRTNILSWWKDNEHIYPTLAKMARDIFSTLASSAPVERFFSGGSLIMTDHRNRMDEHLLKACMCVYSWTKCSLNSEICSINF